uniref:Si:dkey-283b1.7 n=1 Tax=Sinocyclocheilus grahami TaxID=75366 RepID=A0A672T8H1_SINGR
MHCPTRHDDNPDHNILPVRMRSLILCFSFALQCFVLQSASEYSSKSEMEYEFGDYRGKFCMDDQGFVYSIGEVYYPSSTACPCSCTEDGPVCVRPKCPRIHPRCTRITAPCVKLSVKFVCTRAKLTELNLGSCFKQMSPCECCRCEVNREVYCTISGCPALHCVNPVYEPNHCCPVCKNGPNCFAGNRVISAGERVEIDERTVCFCTYRDGTWQMHPHATCEERQQADNEATDSDNTSKQMEDQEMEKEKERVFSPRLDAIP